MTVGARESVNDVGGVGHCIAYGFRLVQQVMSGLHLLVVPAVRTVEIEVDECAEGKRFEHHPYGHAPYRILADQLTGVQVRLQALDFPHAVGAVEVGQRLEVLVDNRVSGVPSFCGGPSE